MTSNVWKFSCCKVETFLKLTFSPITNMQNRTCTNPLTLEHWRNWLPLLFDRKKGFEVKKNVKKLELEGVWRELKPNIYMLRQCKNFIFALNTLMVIEISKKRVHLALKSYFYQKSTNKQCWKLFKVNFLT